MCLPCTQPLIIDCAIPSQNRHAYGYKFDGDDVDEERSAVEVGRTAAAAAKASMSRRKALFLPSFLRAEAIIDSNGKTLFVAQTGPSEALWEGPCDNGGGTDVSDAFAN
jgi:hypothetical protein